MPRSKRHHYVPQFHQRQFGVGLDGDRIWVYDKETDEINLRSIKNTAVIGNYYTVTTADGPNDGLERIFAQIEAGAAPVIRRLCDQTGGRFEIDLPSRFALATYLGLLHGRVPSTRIGSQEIAEYLAAVTMDMRFAHPEGFADVARAAGMTGTDEELENQRVTMLEGLRAGEYRVRAPEAISLDTVIIGMRDVAPYIASMGWWLLKRSTFPGYVVGDDPVTVWPNRNHSPHLGVGFATPDAEVSVPLDPETLLVMGHNVPDGYLFEEETLPGIPWWYLPWPYQYRTWFKARRFVFAQRRIDLQAIQYMQTPEDRQKLGGGLIVGGGPPEWRGYAPRSSAA